MNEATTIVDNTTSEAAEIAPSFKQIFVAISTTIKKGEKNVRVFKKNLAYGLPVLSDCVDGLPEPDKWEEEESADEKGVMISFPVYENGILNYLQTALYQRVVGAARAKDAAGYVPAINWTELLETGTGGGQYMKQKKQFKEGLAIWLTTNPTVDGAVMTLTVGQQSNLLRYTDNRLLEEAESHKKDRVSLFFEAYKASIGEEVAEMTSFINSIDSALTVDPTANDF